MGKSKNVSPIVVLQPLNISIFVCYRVIVIKLYIIYKKNIKYVNKNIEIDYK